MEPLNGRQSEERTYWKSLRELHDGNSVSEAKANEFMAGVTDDFSMDELPGMSRKQFLALLTASAAFAAAGCTNYRDKGEIVPYNKQVEGVVPGIAQHYASTCTGCAATCGILVKTREGRPVKLDGNPDHPVNQGKICAKGQAGILNFYDPNRLRQPLMKGETSGDMTWALANERLTRALTEVANQGKEIALLLHPTVSPTYRKVLQDFQRSFPTARLYSYELFHSETRRNAWKRCYRSGEPPVIEWGKCDTIVALEADVLGTEGHSVEQIRAFAERRSVDDLQKFNRLYCVEGSFSQTGANADYRLRLRPDAQLEFVLSLLNEVLFVKMQGRLEPSMRDLIIPHSLAQFGAKHGLSSEVVRNLVSDLLEHRGRAIVYAGDALPEDVHVAVNYLNEVLGNTDVYSRTLSAEATPGLTSAEEFVALAGRMKSGDVGAVIHCNTNPIYHLPRELGYEEALAAVPLSIALVESEDETSLLCSATLPLHHALESWGDFEARSGITSLRQPVVAPLYDTRQLEGVLLSWANTETPYSETLYLEYLKNHWQKDIFPGLRLKVDFATFWTSALQEGVVLSDAAPPSSRRFNLSAVAGLVPPAVQDGVIVHLTESPFLGDGRDANNGWLQELPHPVSKVVWDNYAALAPSTAQEMGVGMHDLVEVSLDGRTQTFPVFVQAGMAENLISVSLGYGRWHAGPVGSEVGTDAGMLLHSQTVTGGRVLGPARVRKVAGRHQIVTTQEHHSLDDTFVKDLHKKRKIIREGTVAQYSEDPQFIQRERHEPTSITSDIEYNGVKWAMAIDLNKCVGCNACVSGCNVENNIPVVGKEEVRIGREMQWIRIDRYYSGTPEEPSLSHQPMLCQHCDNAPCEKVCPVVATTHSPDGLNQMTYNRCVGTKYCSNNCPYKVRRFNFYDYRDFVEEGYYEQQPINLMHNPEVTVRSRGVMEKCTFCVQRIMEARQHAVEQGRTVAGSDVRTACQEACPAQAITFGDMNDRSSEVSRLRAHDLGYHVLEDLNVRPNVTYIARLRNVQSENNG